MLYTTPSNNVSPPNFQHGDILESPDGGQYRIYDSDEQDIFLAILSEEERNKKEYLDGQLFVEPEKCLYLLSDRYWKVIDFASSLERAKSKIKAKSGGHDWEMVFAIPSRLKILPRKGHRISRTEWISARVWTNHGSSI